MSKKIVSGIQALFPDCIHHIGIEMIRFVTKNKKNENFRAKVQIANTQCFKKKNYKNIFLSDKRKKKTVI